jgi:hypothetical protein
MGVRMVIGIKHSTKQNGGTGRLKCCTKLLDSACSTEKSSGGYSEILLCRNCYHELEAALLNHQKCKHCGNVLVFADVVI